MKKLSILLIFVLILVALVSCEGIGSDFAQEPSEEDRDFAFSYSIEKTEFVRGETINITATVINASGHDYVYTGSSSGFFPSISLYWIHNGTEKGGIIECDPICITTDVVVKRIKHGEGGSIVYSFKIPDDAECTDYSITLGYGKDSKEFLGVLRIVETTEQNANSKYQYSATLIVSDSAEINPISLNIGYSEYKNDELVNTVEIAGFEYIFSSADYKVSEFPTLVRGESISAMPLGNVIISSVRVYDVNYNRLNFTFDSISELSGLPAGEYVIIFDEEADGRGCNPDIKDFRINKSVAIFKLVVL